MKDDNKEFDWLGMYTTARYVLGWSEDEFWRSTPRKYYAVLYKVGELRQSMYRQNTENIPLVGKDALQALSSIASKVK